MNLSIPFLSSDPSQVRIIVDVLICLGLCVRANPAVRALPEPWSASAFGARERHACLPSVTGETVRRGSSWPPGHAATAVLSRGAAPRCHQCRTDAHQTRALRTGLPPPPPRLPTRPIIRPWCGHWVLRADTTSCATQAVTLASHTCFPSPAGILHHLLADRLSHGTGRCRADVVG